MARTLLQSAWLRPGRTMLSDLDIAGGLCARLCEACHIGPPGLGLSMRPSGTPVSRTAQMKTRRLAFWWLRFVFSGRFLEKFLNWRYNAFVARAPEGEASDSTGRSA